ncbi:MAG: hypothetical protein GY861_08045 [bacterium]|nr:hypothetical protein [bacterium]
MSTFKKVDVFGEAVIELNTYGQVTVQLSEDMLNQMLQELQKSKIADIKVNTNVIC